MKSNLRYLNHIVISSILIITSTSIIIKGQNNPTNTFKLPFIEDFKKAYPKHNELNTAETLSARVGGAILEMYERSQNPNTCALRISIALNNSGVKIPKSKYTFRGKDGTNYYLGASNLVDWMKSNFPKPTQQFLLSNSMREDETILNKLENKEGIYAMIPLKPADFGATGHADLFYKLSPNTFDCDGGCYAVAAYEIYFWELPKRPLNRNRRRNIN